MKKMILILCMCGLIFSNVYAQSGAGGDQPKPITFSQNGINLDQTFSMPENITGLDKLITDDLRDIQLADALERIFKAANVKYSISAALKNPPFDKVIVSMKFENAKASDIIKILLMPNSLMVRMENDVLVVFDPAKSGNQSFNTSASQIFKQPANRGGNPIGGAYGGLSGGLGNGFGGNAEILITPFGSTPELVTMSIPSMPVKDAIEKIESGWTFKGNLGNTIMPGAKFYKFQKDGAIALILKASGLISPGNNSKVVNAKGKSDLSDTFTWKPQPSADDYDPKTAVNRGFGPSGGDMAGIGIQSAVSIGAYKSSSNTWLFTVLASRVSDVVLIQRLMDISGRSYVMGDILSRPYTQYQIIFNAKGEPNNFPTEQFAPPTTISVQLYDAALDEVLDNIIPLIGLRYKKQGPANKQVYMIDLKPGQVRMPQVITTAGKVKPSGTITKKK